ncbi:hypothetical protein [[Mycoplasma] anseris]|uniref:Lipoprotein n=1 Tax=[Mycoplasma] anseris TaxID=92400 RepID=A0A2Z4NDH1_9BACT|nr:hypothetical protein [[Mycoplasma] anseris]AWX69644.1 hypothetical protein DP065_02725 [[Mycoplasma] anseris]
MKKFVKLLLGGASLSAAVAAPLAMISCQNLGDCEVSLSEKSNASFEDISQNDLKFTFTVKTNYVDVSTIVITKDAKERKVTVKFDIKDERGNVKTLTKSFIVPKPAASEKLTQYEEWANNASNFTLTVVEEQKQAFIDAINANNDFYYDRNNFGLITVAKGKHPDWKSKPAIIVKLATTPSNKDFQLANGTEPTYPGTDKSGKPIKKISGIIGWRKDNNNIIFTLKPVVFNHDGKYSLGGLDHANHEITVAMPTASTSATGTTTENTGTAA